MYPVALWPDPQIRHVVISFIVNKPLDVHFSNSRPIPFYASHALSESCVSSSNFTNQLTVRHAAPMIGPITAPSPGTAHTNRPTAPRNLVICLQFLGVRPRLHEEQPLVPVHGEGAGDVPGRRFGPVALFRQPPVAQHFAVLR